MKVLIVSNEYTKPGRIGNPIIDRLRDALMVNDRVKSVEFSPFRNSLKSFYEIRLAAKDSDVIHVQFGGIYAFLVWVSLMGVKKPKLLTFHGTDIHAKEMLTTKSKIVKLKIWLNQKASFLSILLFDRLGFVADSLRDYLPEWINRKYQDKFFVQALGVDYDLFLPMTKEDACKALGIAERKYALFSDKSGTRLKRKDIAEAVLAELHGEYEMLVMCGVKPLDVPLYVNACDFVLLTSDQEGSPNITREALSLNKRVFSVDVGDVKQQIAGLKNSAIISREPTDAAVIISNYMKVPYSDNTRETLRDKIDFADIADTLVDIYCDLIQRNVKVI